MSATGNDVAPAQGVSLVFLVRVHEQIKQIVQRSETVLVAAINASMAGRGREVACTGFRAVAADLRRFSAWLSGEMHALQAIIAHESHSVATLQSLRTRMRLLRLADQGNGRLGARVAELEQEMAGLVAAQAQARQAILGRLRDTRSKCRQAAIAARTALFEAAHAGPKAPAMSAAATNIEKLVGELMQQTTCLATLLEDARP